MPLALGRAMMRPPAALAHCASWRSRSPSVLQFISAVPAMNVVANTGPALAANALSLAKSDRGVLRRCDPCRRTRKGDAGRRLSSTSASQDNFGFARDEWSNVPASIVEKMGRNLHLQPQHPLDILRRRIHRHFELEASSPEGCDIAIGCLLTARFHRPHPSLLPPANARGQG